MNGMNLHTGRAIGGQAHLQQSVTDILTTPIGSRVMAVITVRCCLN